MENSSFRTLARVIKYLSIMSFCAFCTLCVDYYYQLENRIKVIEESLDIDVFVKTDQDSKTISDKIEKLDMVQIKEYVSPNRSYQLALQQNPFLKEFEVPNKEQAYQGYFRVFPKQQHTSKDGLSLIRKAIEDIVEVDEVVFDKNAFSKYFELENVFNFYTIAGTIFGFIIAFLFLFKVILFICFQKESRKRIVLNFFKYLIAAILGFVFVWSICLYLQYPLLIKQVAAFYLIPFSAICAVLFRD